MTAYVVFDALRSGEIDWDDEVEVVESDVQNIANDETRMYLAVGDHVTVRKLLEGLIVASANDAANVLARVVGGSLEGFSNTMNDTAKQLGMNYTNLISPSGITTPDHYSTARDLAILARSLTLHFPEYYQFSNQQEFSYRTFEKVNKNKLLSQDPSVDGLKTGYTSAAGWCIIATANRLDAATGQERRVFAVVLGAPTQAQRIIDAHELIEFVFQH